MGSAVSGRERARRRSQLGWTGEKTKRAGTGVEWAAQEKDEAGREGRKVGRGRWAGRAGLGWSLGLDSFPFSSLFFS